VVILPHHAQHYVTAVAALYYIAMTFSKMFYYVDVTLTVDFLDLGCYSAVGVARWGAHTTGGQFEF
jgi:hypothetical protein